MHGKAGGSERIGVSMGKWFHHPASGALRLLVALLLITNLVFGMLVYRKYVAPYSSTLKDYLISTGDELAIWTGRLFWLFVLVVWGIVPIIRGRAPRLIEPWTQKALSKRGRAVTLATAMIVVFVVLLTLWQLAPSLATPVAGKLVAPTLPGDLRLFIIQEGSVKILDRRSFTPIQEFAPIKGLENIAVTRDLRRIFATDFEAGQLHELSTETRQETNVQSVGRTASGLALSADSRKLYVAVQGPIPEGKIDVYDVEGPTPSQIASIRRLGCPISLFAASRIPRLFVATQCGAGLDPVYVIDTRSDQVIARIPGFAVGSGIVATPDGKKVIVSTGDSLRILEDYTSAAPRTTTKRMPVGPLAITSDGQLLLVGTSPGLKSFSTENGNECAEVQLEAVPSAIAVTMDGAIFAALPTRFFVTDVGALSCK